jgi:hypothetical protein
MVRLKANLAFQERAIDKVLVIRYAPFLRVEIESLRAFQRRAFLQKVSGMGTISGVHQEFDWTQENATAPKAFQLPIGLERCGIRHRTMQGSANIHKGPRVVYSGIVVVARFGFDRGRSRTTSTYFSLVGVERDSRSTRRWWWRSGIEELAHVILVRGLTAHAAMYSGTSGRSMTSSWRRAALNNTRAKGAVPNVIKIFSLSFGGTPIEQHLALWVF